MAYSTQDDVLEQLDEISIRQLTDDAGEGEVDADMVSRAIEDADAAIDAYCQGRYTLPLSPVPGMVRRISVDIAIYNLFSRKDDVMPETRKERYENSIRFLKKVNDGKIDLGANTPAAKTTGNAVNIDYNDRIFTRDKMSGF